MNTQPKFKKGDMVRVIGYDYIATIREVNGDYATVTLYNHTIDYFRVTQLILLDSPTPDMLAIPDDHVWPERKKQTINNKN